MSDEFLDSTGTQGFLVRPVNDTRSIGECLALMIEARRDAKTAKTNSLPVHKVELIANLDSKISGSTFEDSFDYISGPKDVDPSVAEQRTIIEAHVFGFIAPHVSDSVSETAQADGSPFLNHLISAIIEVAANTPSGKIARSCPG